MKKRLNLFLVCVAILFSIFVCGCEKKEEKSIYGEYKQVNLDKDKKGRLVLYENGSCEWYAWKEILGELDFRNADTPYCNYDYTDEKITITTTSYVSDIPITSKCSYKENIIDCGSDGKYEK